MPCFNIDRAASGLVAIALPLVDSRRPSNRVTQVSFSNVLVFLDRTVPRFAGVYEVKMAVWLQRHLTRTAGYTCTSPRFIPKRAT